MLRVKFKFFFTFLKLRKTLKRKQRDMIGYWHRKVVCLPVCLSVCDCETMHCG